MSERIEKLITEFETLAKKNRGPVDMSLSHSFGEEFHLVIATATHGNEVGSIEPCLDYFKRFLAGETSFKGKVTLFWGNPEASKMNRRFVEEDLNRVYANLNSQSIEGKRAKQLAPIIQSADIFIDLHQTIEPTLSPFYIFRYSETSLELAQAIGMATELVTKDPLPPGGPEILTQNEFATMNGIPSVTIELGPKGFNASSIKLCEKVLTRIDEIAAGVSQKKKTISDYAADRPPLSIFKMVHREPYRERGMKLRSGLKNLQPVRKGEMIGTTQDDEPIKVPLDGVILFPKYPPEDEPLPTFIYVLAIVITDVNELKNRQG